MVEQKRTVGPWDTQVDPFNYQHLRYFWAVAVEGNLTRAAEKLHVTQSAVSVQLKKLEDSLGHALFARRGRGLELTDAGRVALDFADRIFGEGAELRRALDDADARRQQLLRVGVLATLSRNFQIALLGPMLNRSDVRLSVRSGSMQELVDRLQRHDLDLVLSNFMPRENAGSTWVAHTLDAQPVSLIAHPEASRGRPIEQLLRSEPLVLPTRESGVRIAFDAFMQRLGIRPRIAAEVDDMAMLRLVTRAHRGLAVLPPIVVQDELHSGDLVELRQLPGLVETFYALCVDRHQDHPMVRELLHLGESLKCEMR